MSITTLAAQISGFDYHNYLPDLPDLPDRHARKYSKDILATMSAAEMAIQDTCLLGPSGRFTTDVDRERVAIYASSSRGHMSWWHQQYSGASFDHVDTPQGGVLASLSGSQASSPMTSVKPSFGHLLRAAGLVNCMATALMIKN
ncbi:MAG: hypothetical protein WBG36_00015 [Ornithinimicrobium sp.]